MAVGLAVEYINKRYYDYDATAYGLLLLFFYKDPCLLTIQFTRNATDKIGAKIEKKESSAHINGWTYKLVAKAADSVTNGITGSGPDQLSM